MPLKKIWQAVSWESELCALATQTHTSCVFLPILWGAEQLLGSYEEAAVWARLITNYWARNCNNAQVCNVYVRWALLQIPDCHKTKYCVFSCCWGSSSHVTRRAPMPALQLNIIARPLRFGPWGEGRRIFSWCITELWEFQRAFFADALCLSERIFYMEAKGRTQRCLGLSSRSVISGDEETRARRTRRPSRRLCSPIRTQVR